MKIVPRQFSFGKAAHGFALRQRARLIATSASIVLAVTGMAFTPTQARAALACSVDLSGSTIGQSTSINMFSVASACGVAGNQFAGFTTTNGVDTSTSSVPFTAVGYSANGSDYVPTPTTLPSPDGHANVTFNQPNVAGGNDFDTMVFTVNSTNGSTSAVFSQFFCDSNGDFIMDTACSLTIQLPPLLAPTATVSASPTTIAVGATSTLTFTLANPNGAAALAGVADTVTLPAGVTVAATPNASTTCGGTFTPAAGSSSLALSGGSLAASASCTFKADVAATTTGTKTIPTGTPSATSASPGAPGTSATLTVNAPLTTAQAVPSTTLTANTPAASFTPVTASGGVGTLSYALSGATLPAGLNFSTSSGLISGTPTTLLATATFTVIVTDQSAPTQNSSQTFNLTVNAPTLVTTSAVPSIILTTNTPAAPFTPVTASGGFGAYSFGLSGGTLPSGLSFSPSTGQISGTPTTLLSATVFTVTVTDHTTPTAQTSSKTFTLTVNAAPLVTTSTVPNMTLTTNTLATPFTPVTASGGFGTYSYVLTGGTLPSGLNFNTTTGQITGTPTTLLSATTFTVTVTDQAAQTSFKTFTLTVNAAPLNTAAAVPSTTLTAGTAATPFIPVTASGGFGTYTFALSGGTLPTGLTFSTTTGQISGTPTALLSVTSFTVTVTDQAAQTSFKTFTLTVNAAPLNTTAAVPTTTLTVGSPATPFTPVTASGGFGTLSFALSGATLPSGLSFSSTTGQITGTPTVLLSATTFTVTVTDQAAQTSAKTFSLTVTAVTLVTTSAVPTTTLTAGTAATPFTPVTATGGFGTLNFALSGGTLPAGLGFSTSTGQITGTPTALLAATNFTVTVTDQTTPTAQTSAKTFSLTVTAATLVTTPAIPTTTLTAGSAATPFTPVTASGGFGTLTFALSGGTLPGGLSFSTTTGQITGTPATALTVTSFTVTVTDQTTPSIQTSSKTFNLTVNPALTTAQAIPSTTLTAGSPATPFTPVTAAGGFGTLSFALSGATLPGGLTFSTTTGQISGTPAMAAAAAIFTVTVTDQTTPTAQTSSKTFSLTVAAPVFTFTPAAGALAPALAGSAYSQTIATSGGTAPYTYSITTGTLPAGLSLNTATGTISGTATAPGNSSFTITSRDAHNQVGSVAYTLNVTVPAVIAVSSSATAVPGISITVDLTNGATGGPFTSAQLVSLSPPTAGTALITMGDTASNSDTVVAALVAGGRYLLKFTPSAAFSGTAIATFTISNAFATSAAATITFKVVPRPDPSKDPEVIGLVNAQAQAAQHFASTQITNFNDRLEALHDSNCHRNAFHLGLTDSRMPVDTDPLQKTSAAKGNNLFGNNGFGSNGVGNSGPGSPGLFGPATSDTGSGNAKTSDSSAANGSPGRSDNAVSRSGRRGAAAKRHEPDDSSSGCNGNEAVQRFAAWTGGYVNYGRLNTGVSSTVDYFATGVSAGVDYWFSPAFTGGIGFGYGNDKSTIGSNGTISTAFSYDIAAYGSWHPSRNTFVDAVVGYGIMSFTSSRYITGSGDVFANGERGGHQVFGSITSGYDYRDKGLLISPYGRVSASWSTLDPFTESGGGIFALQYGAQTISSFTGGFGLRGAYEFRQSWGILAPRARLEYNHEFAGASTAYIAYADLVGIGGLNYALPITPTGSDYVTAGLGTDFNFLSGWVLGLDYRTTVGQERTMPQLLQFKLRTQF